ncbi:MAG: hypothetical protein SNJ58_07165 [Aggregatilineales bacterium]
MVLPIPAFLIRPGFARAVIGMIVGGVVIGTAYAAIALGEKYIVALLCMVLFGLFFGGVRGLLFGLLLHVPVHLLLHWPVPPQTADFGTILVALIVYLALVPGGMLTHGFLVKRFIGAGIAAVLVVPAYVTFLVAFPLAPGDGIVQGSLLILAGIGGTFGFLWGMGAMAPGASAHEGPAYWAAVEAAQKPRFGLREAIGLARKVVPPLVETFRPLIQPIAVAVGVTLGLVFLIFMIVTNPIVPVSRLQTANEAASAVAITGDKLIAFIVVTLVVIGAVASLAIGLALLMRYANREVNAAKEMKPEPISNPPWPLRLADFAITWINDIFRGLRSTFQR